MFLYKVFLLFFLSIHSIQCSLLNISMGIVNIPTVIACGSSIDIYSSFDPAQVSICPYVSIENDQIQLLYMNITFDDYNQIIIYSDPELIALPKFLIKLPNNSFITPVNLHRNFTYYLSFSSELMCRYSFIENETICFYYPISSDFNHIEYHYDEIQHGSLNLSDKLRTRFYMIFVIIIIFIIIITLFGLYIICTNKHLTHHIKQFDLIIDKEMARQEAARRPQEPLQEGNPGQHVPVEHVIINEGHIMAANM